ncbi:MAG: transaldolase family protein [Candidatus Bathyarchaeia archaeon]
MSIEKIILCSKPEPLDFPALSFDHADHVVRLAVRGYTKLAADHLLNREMIGSLEDVVAGVNRKFSFMFNRVFIGNMNLDLLKEERKILTCARIYDALIQAALNIVGFEKEIIGFSDVEAAKAFASIVEAAKEMEALERRNLGEAKVAQAVIKLFLSDMRKVMSGFHRPPGAMVAHIAEDLEKKVDLNNVMESFLKSAKESIRNNVYYRLSKEGLCKFGNDYALGLRWLRHLGFVQVSTNPVLAAAAFDDDPTLWEGYKGEDLCPDFKTAVEGLKEQLRENPDLYGDEIAAKGTEVCIWPNLAVFRPIAIASNMRHGMVSLQLNPTIADDYEKSFREALKIYADAEEFLKKYDHYLLWGYSTSIEHGRPNIVFKVAGSSPASIELTRRLESLGIGTNNTVTFTVSQEVELILAKIRGRAEAVKKGLRLTTVYETSMIGRHDDHLREVHAEELLRSALEKSSDKEGALKELAEAMGVWDNVKEKKSMDEKIKLLCSRRFLSPISKEPFTVFLASHGVPYGSKEKVAEYLAKIEEAIGLSGILITKRVYEIFFSPQNIGKWLYYIQSEFGLSGEQADAVIQGIDALPASKRKPEETLLLLASSHMTHTEFPNHQMSVLLRSLDRDFNISKYRESVFESVDPEIPLRIMCSGWKHIAEEFIKAFELTDEQIALLKKVGITAPEKYGCRGLKPSEWRNYGATVKTMNEFSESYENFKRKCVEYAKKFLRKLEVQQ